MIQTKKIRNLEIKIYKEEPKEYDLKKGISTSIKFWAVRMGSGMVCKGCKYMKEEHVSHKNYVHKNYVYKYICTHWDAKNYENYSGIGAFPLMRYKNDDEYGYEYGDEMVERCYLMGVSRIVENS